MIILTAFNHHAGEHVLDAYRLEPGRWPEAQHDYRFDVVFAAVERRRRP